MSLPNDLDNRRERTAVLLGAGASRDAELPLTEHLAEQLVASFDRELKTMNRWARQDQEPVVRALHIVYGAMVSHATEQGHSPLSAVNVERLVSAVRLLRDRRTHEAAPFIAAWKAAIEDVDDHPLPISDSDLGQHVGFKHDLRFEVNGLARDIATIAKATMAPGDGATFARLEDELLRRICELLSAPKSVAYLHPLIRFAERQPGGLDITKLNYDLTIELAAAECGVPVDSGLSRWQPGTPMTFENVDGRINLRGSF